MATIRGIEGDYKGRCVSLKPGRLDIGREKSNSLIFPNDALLSRRHASIFYERGSWYCMDLNSTNGTFLDGQMVGSKPVLIKSGGTVSCGAQAFQIHYDQSLINKVVAMVAPPVNAPPIIAAPYNGPQFDIGPVKPPPRSPAGAPTQQPVAPKANFQLPPDPTGLPPERVVGHNADWYGPGTILSIHGLTIVNPLIYVGESLELVERYGSSGVEIGRGNEPSLIIPKRKVVIDRDNFNLPYWPSYEELKPDQRGTYLCWLARGRRGPICQGMVFLFYYGLERRLLTSHGKLTGLERKFILDEIVALRAEYRNHGSFQSYSAALLTAFRPAEKGVSFESLTSQGGPDPFGWNLGCLLIDGQKFTVEHASQWLKSRKASIDNRVVTQRSWEGLKALFRIRVERHIGLGLPLTIGKGTLEKPFHPANITLKSFGGQKTTMRLAAEQSDLHRFLQDTLVACMADLDAYAKRRGPQPSEHDKARAKILLPVDIRTTTTFAKKLARELMAATAYGSIPLSDLMKRTGLGSEPFRKPELVIFDLIRDLGFAVQPNPNLKLISPDRVEVLGVIQAETVLAPESADLDSCLAASWLAWSLGSYAGFVADHSDVILQSLSQRMSVREDDLFHAQAFVNWLKAQDPKPPPALVSKISPNKRVAAGRVLVDLFHRLPITPKSVQGAEKLLTSLDWKSSDIYPALHDGESAVIVSAAVSSPTYTIPAQQTEPVFKLDTDKIKARLTETREVNGLLGNVFKDEEEEEMFLPASTQVDAIWAFIAELPSGDLSENDFAALAKSHGLMAAAALDRVNELACEVCGYVVIEVGESLKVDEEGLEVLRGSLG